MSTRKTITTIVKGPDVAVGIRSEVAMTGSEVVSIVVVSLFTAWL
jgi:hypothetical protein